MASIMNELKKKLVKNDFTTMESSLNLPLIYYSNLHNVTLQYSREQFYEDTVYPNENGTSPLERVKVTLFGKEKKDIEDLEWLIKGESKKYEGVDKLE